MPSPKQAFENVTNKSPSTTDEVLPNMGYLEANNYRCNASGVATYNFQASRIQIAFCSHVGSPHSPNLKN